MKKVLILLSAAVIILFVVVFLVNFNSDKKTQDEDERGKVAISITGDQGITTTGPKDGNKTVVSEEEVFKINCFGTNSKNDFTAVYTGMIEDVYVLPEDIRKCLNDNYEKTKQRIKKGDVYLNSVDQLVLYKGTYFTGRQVLKLNSMIDLR